MRYEINIALGGHHWARVDLGHATEDDARDKAQTLDSALRKWRMDRGVKDLFTVTLTRWCETGTTMQVW